MKRVRYLTSFVFFLLLPGIVVFCASRSQATGTVPFAFTSRLVTSSEIHLEEPILLSLTVTNLTNQRMVISLGPAERLDDPIERQAYRPGWYGVSLKDANGNTLSKLPCMNKDAKELSATNLSSGYIDAQDKQISYCSVSRYLNIAKPGRYFLEVSVFLPYASLSEDSENTMNNSLSALAVFHAVKEVPITVLPYDQDHAKATAIALCRRIEDAGSDRSQADALTDALFGMPDAIASKSWYALATIPRGDLEANMTTAAVELARLETARSADILADIAFSPLNSSQIEYKYRPSYLLERMYNKGDDHLRDHIRLLYARHGISDVPDKFFEFAPIN